MNQQTSIDVSGVMDAALATGLFVSVCTIQAPPDTVNAQGGQNLNPADFVDISAELTNIPCMQAVMTLERPDVQDETKLGRYTKERNVSHILLFGYFPQILQRYQAVIDGVPHDILAVEWSSQKTVGKQTRLAVQVKTL
jgi:hypothetical protein